MNKIKIKLWLVALLSLSFFGANHALAQPKFKPYFGVFYNSSTWEGPIKNVTGDAKVGGLGVKIGVPLSSIGAIETHIIAGSKKDTIDPGALYHNIDVELTSMVSVFWKAKFPSRSKDVNGYGLIGFSKASSKFSTVGTIQENDNNSGGSLGIGIKNKQFFAEFVRYYSNYNGVNFGIKF